MTNYRLSICELHDGQQWNFCPDCGSPLTEDMLNGEETLTCSKLCVHIRIMLRPHEGDSEGDCEGVKVL